MRNSIHSWVHRAEIDRTHYTAADDTSFAHLTGEEIVADGFKASAMKSGSDNELDEPQKCTIKKLLSSARDGTNTVINYVRSSTNRELQEQPGWLLAFLPHITPWEGTFTLRDWATVPCVGNAVQRRPQFMSCVSVKPWYTQTHLFGFLVFGPWGCQRTKPGGDLELY